MRETLTLDDAVVTINGAVIPMSRIELVKHDARIPGSAELRMKPRSVSAGALWSNMHSAGTTFASIYNGPMFAGVLSYGIQDGFVSIHLQGQHLLWAMLSIVSNTDPQTRSGSAAGGLVDSVLRLIDTLSDDGARDEAGASWLLEVIDETINTAAVICKV